MNRPILEKVLPEAGTGIAAFVREAEPLDCPLHYHPEVELTFVERGHGLRVIGDQVEAFADGDLCLIGSDLPHLYKSPASEDISTTRSVTVQFPRSLVEGFGSLPELRGLQELCREAERGLAFRLPAPAIWARRAANLVTTCGVPRVTALLDMLAVLATLPTRRLASPTSTTPSESDELEASFELILTRFREPLSQAEVARQAGLSPTAFSRHFKRATKLTFSQFLNRVRLGNACRLLQQSTLPINEIAFSSGFENLSNFNRRFREAYGQSPREYRKMLEARGGLQGGIAKAPQESTRTESQKRSFVWP
ncbi:MAG: AraC family transcriptional regulator [Opitutales bacterium]